MNMSLPIQNPITGKEDIADLAQPLAALAQFYRALNSRDLDLMGQNWDDSDAAAMDNPLGGISRGWPEIRSVYGRLFVGKSRYHFEFYDYTLQRHGDVFVAIGRERGYFAPLASPSFDLAIRTTRIFFRRDHRWRQIHHHGSIDDPDMLAQYQQAVLQRAA
ncbi:MAG: YybH family protein [Candidatus Sulfotelmatobacter sp.]